MYIDEKICISVDRGCPQGGVLSPLLWSLVVDSLIRRLNEKGYFTLGYADDLTIIHIGKFCDVLSDMTQEALNIVQNWCFEQ